MEIVFFIQKNMSVGIQAPHLMQQKQIILTIQFQKVHLGTIGYIFDGTSPNK